MSSNIYRTAAYLRLSKGDGDVDGFSKSESNSISNQRLIIERFLRDNDDLELIESYIDDGYTGTNFERPAMQRMLEDIDKGLIDCVIVKDLSRFGREKVETGMYILKEFEAKGIRFIAINDNYDSLTAGSSDKHLVMPIKTMTNDFYSQDISNKVKASQSVKRAKGEFMGAQAPFGYIKDPDNVNHLLVDPAAANVVREIFAKRIGGMSANEIAEHLKSAGVPTPSCYKADHDPTYKNTAAKPGKSNWTARQVLMVLTNKTYLGAVVQGKTRRVSYKVKRRVKIPKDEWCVVPDMHEPIVSESDFNIVQNLLQRDTMKAAGRQGSYLFSGLLFCGDCGSPLLRRLRNNKHSSHVEYLCKGYMMKDGCSSHKILEDDLTAAVIASVNSMISRLCTCSELASNLENIAVSKEEAIIQNEKLIKLRDELEKIEIYRSGLFVDVQDGLISSEMYERLKNQYDEQTTAVNQAIAERTQLIESLYEKGLAADEFIKKFRDRPKIEKLDRVLLVTLIDRILVHEDGKIEIIYRYTDRMETLNQIIGAEISDTENISTERKEGKGNGQNRQEI